MFFLHNYYLLALLQALTMIIHSIYVFTTTISVSVIPQQQNQMLDRSIKPGFNKIDNNTKVLFKISYLFSRVKFRTKFINQKTLNHHNFQHAIN